MKMIQKQKSNETNEKEKENIIRILFFAFCFLALGLAFIGHKYDLLKSGDDEFTSNWSAFLSWGAFCSFFCLSYFKFIPLIEGLINRFNNKFNKKFIKNQQLKDILDPETKKNDN